MDRVDCHVAEMMLVGSR